MDIWGGAVWGLFTSAFVHVALWHVAANVYWLWTLGIPLEREVGSRKWLGIFLVSALVTSSLQLAVTDEMGIGFSGVLYAFFGFMWVTRDRVPAFGDVLDTRTVWIFIVWMFACIGLTAAGVLNVGNVAHVSGLLVGVMMGAAYRGSWPGAALAGLAGSVVVSVVVLLWCPWSITWLSMKAYDAQVAGHPQKALDYYERVLRRDPRNAWAYYNRSLVLFSLARWDEAEADRNRAIRLDPSLENHR